MHSLQSHGAILICTVTVGMLQGHKLHGKDTFMQMFVFWQLTTPELLYSHRAILLLDISVHGKTWGFAFSRTGMDPNTSGTMLVNTFIYTWVQFAVTTKASAY